MGMKHTNVIRLQPSYKWNMDEWFVFTANFLFTQRIFLFLEDLQLDQLLFEKDEFLRTLRDHEFLMTILMKIDNCESWHSSYMKIKMKSVTFRCQHVDRWHFLVFSFDFG